MAEGTDGVIFYRFFSDIARIEGRESAILHVEFVELTNAELKGSGNTLL